MGKINFKELDIYTDISREHTIQVDARKEFANFIYMNINGIIAHDLAFKILHSDGEIEVSTEEKEIIIKSAMSGLPPFYDSVVAVFEKQ